MEPETVEQPTQDSMEDKIANIFGGSDETANEPELEAEPQGEVEAQPPVDEMFEFEYDGERFSLPKKLEKAVLQEKDYTQKSQSLADLRRNLEVKEAQQRVREMDNEFAKSVSEQVRQLQMYDAALAQPVDWSAMTTDQIIRKKLELDQWKDERQALLTQVQGKRAEFEKSKAGEIDKIKSQALETIKKRIQNWTPETVKQLRDHAINEGYTDAELNELYDPRMVVTLWKAAEFDRLQSKATATVSQVKAIQPSPTKQMDAKTKNYLNFRKTINSEKPDSPKFKQALSDRIAAKFGG